MTPTEACGSRSTSSRSASAMKSEACASVREVVEADTGAPSRPGARRLRRRERPEDAWAPSTTGRGQR